jgi:hypothetical protein
MYMLLHPDILCSTRGLAIVPWNGLDIFLGFLLTIPKGSKFDTLKIPAYTSSLLCCSFGCHSFSRLNFNPTKIAMASLKYQIR